MPAVTPGRTIGREFVIERPLSSGGMGAVFVALQTSTGIRRAIKLMRPEILRDAGLRERFAREARIGASIPSDHVVQVITAGIDDETAMPFLVMELLDGEELSTAIRRRSVEPSALGAIFEQLCHAVGAAHRAGIVHRDLKPENIFLSRPRIVGSALVVKVLDFGIAKIVAEARAQTTEPLGTPLWMAPEQTARGSSVSPQTDVWALGLIAFFCLTGHVYWSAVEGEHPSVERLLRQILLDDLVPPSTRAGDVGVMLPSWFDAWFAQCVHRDPTARFADATQLWSDLDRRIRDQRPLARPGPMPLEPPHEGAAPAAARDCATVASPEPLGPRPRNVESSDLPSPSPNGAGATSIAAASDRPRDRTARRFGWILSAVVVLAGSLALRALIRSSRSDPAPRGNEPSTNPTAVDSAATMTGVESNVTAWNAAHATKNADALRSLYADSVLYYGSYQSRQACIASKRAFLAKNPDFTQQFVGQIQVVSQGDSVRAEFVKRVLLRGRTTDYPSYLVFARSSTGWQIVTEGDAITDANLAKKAAKAAALPATGVVGDFNGDGSRETVRLLPPKMPDVQTEDNFGECVGKCICQLVFSSATLPPITVENCIHGSPVNEGDLDDDGADEIGLLPGWWSSCWHGYNVYTFKHGRWGFLVDPISTHCNQWDQGIDAIEKDRSRAGHVIVRYTDMSESGFDVRSKSIRVK
jgi:serine/threonine protein kinase